MADIGKRPFAKTGKSVSPLGLGTVKFGRNTGVKYPQPFDLPADAEIEALLDLCLENGINLLDTAPAYGTSEERLGRLLGARRDSFFLVTKTGEEYDGENSRYDFSRAYTEESIAQSLRRLRTDCLDCVLVHCNRDDVAVLRDTPVLETLSRLKEKGDILSFGASTATVEGGMLAADLTDCVMVAYNSGYRAEEAVLSHARSLDRAVLVKKGLSSGHSADPAADVRFATEPSLVTSLIFGSLNPANILANINALVKG